MSSTKCEYIDTQSAWDTCLGLLNRESMVAVDLEANSLYVYREQVCLIQLSIPGNDFIVDPLADIDLSEFGALLANDAIEKVFHACEYDLMLLKRDYDWDLRNLFDTMWAARILGYKHMGLAWFLREFYDVEVSKKYQKANWGARPLTPELLAYAQGDTHHLLALRGALAAHLEEAGKTVEAQEIFVHQCAVRLPDQDFSPDGFWSIKGARALTPQQQSVLKALYVFRDEEARRRNQPAFKVLNNEALTGMATALPKTKKELSTVRGIGPRNNDRYGSRLLEILRDAPKGPAPERPKRKKRPEPGVTDRFERLSNWRRDRALARGVESEVILARETLWGIARGNP
ncbi:MAG: HRDC domain-containing protein, partial [Candidatus Hydrogenedentes bacterium]|nr:HRDC domain-containing protein [Candidatus Hydrogenedentota bacterium]